MSTLSFEVASWRLSRIEEEIEGLNMNDDGPQRIKSQSSSREGTMVKGQPPELPLPPYPYIEQIEEDIYSKAIVEDKEKMEMYTAKEASRFLTEKYDSLGRIHKPPSPLPPPRPETPSVPLAQPHGYGTFPGAKKYNREDSQSSSYNSDELPSMPELGTPINSIECGSLPAPPSPRTLNYNPYGNLDCLPLTDGEIAQVEMFYRSHKTEVFVSQCIVYLYVGSSTSSVPRLNSIAGAGALPDTAACGENWIYMKSGVLVVVMDSGESRRNRKLSIVLAERGTGFVLWKDHLDHLTEYQAPQPCFQTMHLSNDHAKLAGLRFTEATAAALFHQRISSLTSDPEDSAMRLSGSSKKSKDKKQKDKKQSKGKQKLPSKADISSPCCFTHVTKLDRTDGMCMLSTPLASSAPPPRRQAAAASPLQSKHRV